ncbi:MAG: diaminopimelate epimerase [Schwartzia sp.]|nr:diaminopimelate epimerase [Schwartzia sp. (in: firmicutes)]
MALAFTKWQGCGNDFVLIDARTAGLPENAAGLSRRVCDRHYGIGADGLIFVLPSKSADFCMRIFNADGSEAEMCGNGIRCFARLVYDEGMTESNHFTVETGAGILTPSIVKKNGQITGIKVDMGEPVLEAKHIPVEGFGDKRVISEAIEVLEKRYEATCVSMGNPHCVIFVDNIDDIEIERVGPAFERHDWFPKRTNTEFVVVRDREHLRMRVWERGASITLACGTGACASLVAAVLNGYTERCAEVELDGGRLTVEWMKNNNHIYMTGPAEKIFSGILEEEERC